MKRSTYNSVIPLGSGLSLLYNAVSDEFLVFKNGLLDKEWNPESLGTQLYDRLKQGNSSLMRMLMKSSGTSINQSGSLRPIGTSIL